MSGAMVHRIDHQLVAVIVRVAVDVEDATIRGDPQVKVDLAPCVHVDEVVGPTMPANVPNPLNAPAITQVVSPVEHTAWNIAIIAGAIKIAVFVAITIADDDAEAIGVSGRGSERRQTQNSGNSGKN
jgi:hypothetical protein